MSQAGKEGLNELIIEKVTDYVQFNESGERSLLTLLMKAKYSCAESEIILGEYKVFKTRLHDLNLQGKFDSELIRLHEHLLYVLHKCDQNCSAKTMKKCSERGKVVIPKQPIPIKFLHLFQHSKFLALPAQMCH